MAIETIFQSSIILNFILPFLIIFTLIFAVLQKTKLLGDNATQINAIVSLAISMIFIAFVGPKDILTNLVLFLSISIVVAFIGMILIGFLFGQEMNTLSIPTGLKWTIGIIVVIITLIALIWASGFDLGVLDFFFFSSWSQAFWTNAIFAIVVAAAIAWIITSQKNSTGDSKKKE